jgi:hypothetical protein
MALARSGKSVRGNCKVWLCCFSTLSVAANRPTVVDNDRLVTRQLYLDSARAWLLRCHATRANAIMVAR